MFETYALNIGDIQRVGTLARLQYRPKAIRDLKAEIEADTRRLEVYFANGGVIDNLMIWQIVEKKLRLDGLYTAWMMGRIS